MALVSTKSIASALAERFSDEVVASPTSNHRYPIYHSFEDELAAILGRYQHCITYMEEDVMFAAERHGLSEDYAMARLYAHPLCIY